MDNVIIPEWYEKHIKEKPFEERVRERVRADCHYMDKLDIYEWIVNDEIKINNLQSRLDKIKDYLQQVHDETQKGILSSNYLIWTNIERLCDGLDILKEKE